MSVSSEITRINTNIAAAYTAANGKGATMPLTQNSANLANTIGSIQQGSSPTLQEKSATPSTSAQIIEPDSGYDGLSKVNIAATPLETATITPTTQQQTVTPTSPAIGFDSVTVEAVSESMKNVNFDAFMNDTLESYSTTATSIPAYAFRNKYNMHSFSMPNVTTINDYAFSGCTNLDFNSLPNGLTTIRALAFQSCNLRSLQYLPSSITSIETSGFRESNISLVELPPNITVINQTVFYNCRNLAITKLPLGVTQIGAFAFGLCTSIPYLDMSDFTQIPILSNANAFSGTTFPFLYADQTQLDSWASASNWSALASRFQIKGA